MRIRVSELYKCQMIALFCVLSTPAYSTYRPFDFCQKRSKANKSNCTALYRIPLAFANLQFFLSVKGRRFLCCSFLGTVDHRLPAAVDAKPKANRIVWPDAVQNMLFSSTEDDVFGRLFVYEKRKREKGEKFKSEKFNSKKNSISAVRG